MGYEVLETEVVSHAQIIIAKRTKLRPLTTGQCACMWLSVLPSASLGLVVPARAVVPKVLHTCWLAPAGLLCSCAEAVLSDQVWRWV